MNIEAVYYVYRVHRFLNSEEPRTSGPRLFDLPKTEPNPHRTEQAAIDYINRQNEALHAFTIVKVYEPRG
ncbi:MULTISPECIES: hypothetical protein [Spirosoma]|uniref:Uncharacterized protein n=1 Tax=Spirosoma liriopis TaxID=2937440 RepID=A0ABT0HQZ9_9BACT|nr:MULTISPECIES: hypothetical protein [Spirosoma]MCK8494547.1 hypothetical protein [Spirosoma liriopis]UHG89555.1 hypothetical protein LQ777_15015 [Spirosoma oryzicola]